MAMALDVKKLRFLQDIDTIFSNQKSILVVNCMYEPCLGLFREGDGSCSGLGVYLSMIGFGGH